MLKIIVPGEEYYNELTETFEAVDSVELDLEHSLISLSKWESEFKIPFLSSGEKTPNQILSYIRCMVITPGVNSAVVSRFTQDNLTQVNSYIEDAYSATVFGTMPERRGRGETITSELIYYWMVAFTIPFECETWHLNRLFALIRICNIKNGKGKKMSRNELATRNRELNAQRKAQLNTTG
jgi:hypothetical protein